MTPDIRLEFRLKVKAGPQTIGVAFLQKAHAANEDLVRRPVSSTYDVFIGMQYGYTTAPHLSRVVITGPYNADRPRRHAEPAAGVRVPPGVAGRRRRRARSRSSPRSCAARIDVRRPTRTSSRCSPSISDERAKTGNFEAGIEMALRRILADPEFIFRFEPTPAGVAAGDAVSHQRHRAGVAAVVLPVVVDPGRRAAEAGDRRQAAPAGRARAADAPDAGRPEGAGAGHQLRQPVAVPARAEERQPRRHGVPGLRRQPASGVPARNRAAVRERHAREPLGAGSARRRTTRS